MKKVISMCLCFIFVLCSVFSLDISKAFATDISAENGYNDIVTSVKNKSAAYDKVKFRYTYRAQPIGVQPNRGIVKVISIVLADFKKNEAKIKSIVYYKHDKRVIKIKVLCKRDLELEDYKYKFSSNSKNISGLQDKVKSFFEQTLFNELSTSRYFNTGSLIYDTFNKAADPNDYHKSNNGFNLYYKNTGTYLGEDIGFTITGYVDSQNFRKSFISTKYNIDNHEVSLGSFEFIK